MKRIFTLLLISFAITFLTSCTEDFIYDEDSIQSETTYKLNIFNTDSLTVEQYLRKGMWRPQSILLVRQIDKYKNSYKVKFDKEYLHETILGDVNVVFEFTEGNGIDAYFSESGPNMTHKHYQSYHYDEKKRILTMGDNGTQFSIVSVDNERLVLLQKRYAYNTSAQTYLYIYKLMTNDQRQQFLSDHNY